MAFTKFKLLTQRLLSGLGKTKSFFPFYDSENDADYRVSLDTLITFISNELGVSTKAVFELTGVSNTGNNYVSTLDISSYKTEGLYIFKPSADSDNVTTLNVNTVGILNIKEFDGTNIVDKTDLKAVNTYLLLNKTSYWLVVGGVNGGTGGVSTFSALTDSPYDNTLLAEALNSKQDKPNGVLTGCTITLGSYGGSGSNNDIRVTEGTWRISPSEYSNVGLGNTDFLDIALSASGLQRYVELVGTNVNTIIKIEGAENAIAVRPTLGVGQVSLGSILVKDALIDPPVPDLSGYVPINGSSLMSGYFQTVELGGIRSGFEMQYSGLNLYANGTSSKTYTSYVSDRFNVYTDDYSVPANSRAFKQEKGVAYEIYQDIVKITGLSDVQIAAKLDSEPKGLITKKYADDHYSTSSLTQASQAQVEAAFDNTAQGTPTTLEQTSALTPFNAWWLVQKIKAFFDALYLKLTGGTLTGALNYAPSVIPATSATPAIGAAASNNITITSTTTITGFDTIAEGAIRRVKFAAITPLVHSANLDLPTSANITTAVGDEAVFRSNGGGSWKCISFLRKDGSALLTTDQFTAMMEIAVSVNTGSVITSLISATYKYIRLTGCTGLGTILAPSTTSYKDLYIWNDTGNTITLYHNYATDANSILCGANRSWANNTMLHLKYDAIELRWCTVAQDGNTFRALLAGSGTRIVQADSTGQEQAVITTLDIDFTSPQQTSATGASWAGVNEVNIVGLLQGQLYIDVSGGYRYECHRNDYCSRTPIINVETFTTNSLYPIFEITGTSGTFVEDSAYVINNASLVTMSLPSTGTQGKVIIVNGKGAGGWKITVPNTQQIVGGLTNSTTAGSGYIEATGATKQFASVTLKCITSGTAAVWEIVCINPATTLTIA